jgi:hypothetical protein
MTDVSHHLHVRALASRDGSPEQIAYEMGRRDALINVRFVNVGMCLFLIAASLLTGAMLNELSRLLGWVS